MIGGIVALLSPPLKIHSALIKKSWLLLFVVFLPVILLIDGTISRIDGLTLILAFIIYFISIIQSENPLNHRLGARQTTNLFRETLVLLFSLLVLFFSANLITMGASSISKILSLPIFFVGTIVAVGTCLPELTVSLNASNKRHAELGFGDILGNVFADCTATIGIIALISPITLEYPLLAISTGLFIALGLLLLIILFNYRKELTKKEGVFLILLYIIFLIVQFLIELNARCSGCS